MKILALDLGTTTGVAHNLRNGISVSSLQLATPKEIKEWGKTRLTRRSDPRIARLFAFLSGFDSVLPDLIIYEDVQFSSTTYQTQLWASFRTVVWLYAGLKVNSPIVDCVPVQTLKKFATGHGGATKESMKWSARVLPWWTPKLDDNAIDAGFLFEFAKARIKL